MKKRKLKYKLATPWSPVWWPSVLTEPIEDQMQNVLPGGKYLIKQF
jgi:hypothetical protein